ncbi:hypothetical protein BHE74_00012227 [Ensete ventricosum]|nr:hypothetical protein BHE74_00012227 [Ensete ventricosum]
MEAEMRSLRWPSMMRERWSKVTLRETATETKRKERERMRRPAFLAMPAASVCYSSCGRPSAGFIEGQGCGRKAGEERARQLRTSNPVMSPGNRGNCSCVDDHHFPCMRVSSAGDWGKPKGTGKAMSVQVRVACPIQDGIQLLSPNYYSASGTDAPYVLPYLKPVSIWSSRSYPRADICRSPISLRDPTPHGPPHTHTEPLIRDRIVGPALRLPRGRRRAQVERGYINQRRTKAFCCLRAEMIRSSNAERVRWTSF